MPVVWRRASTGTGQAAARVATLLKYCSDRVGSPGDTYTQ